MGKKKQVLALTFLHVVMLVLDPVEYIFFFLILSDSSGFIFDLQSNTVLAQGGALEKHERKGMSVYCG